MRIPGRADLARRHHVTFFHVDHGAVRDLVALALTAEIIDHADFARAGHRHQVPLLMLHCLDVVEADETLVTDLNAACRRRSRRCATDVERTHRELRSRLTDRLRRDNTNRLTDADRTAAGEIAPVAGRADAIACLTADGRTHHHLVHAISFELAHHLLIEQRALGDQHFFGAWLQNVFRDNAAEHSLAQLLHDVTTLDERSHGQAARRTAIDLGDDQILRHVDE